MDDEEDVKKIMEVIKCNKEENAQEFEYEEFINYNSSDEEIDDIINDTEDDYTLCDLTSTDISNLHTYDPRSSLKPEERNVVDSCTDPELKNILLLNRTKNIQLIQLYKKMKDLLIECQQNIADKNKIIKAHAASNKGLTNSTGAWRLAAPYFKDKQLFCSPSNADILRKKANNELSIYDLSVSLKWSNFECEKLVRAVKLNFNINQQNAVRKQIQEIKQNGIDEKEKLIELENRLKELSADDFAEVPPLNSDDYIDWMRVAEVFLRDKHTVFECKSMWNLYLHPEINKSTWTPAENAKLKELVKKYNYQNWDKIADELGTKRTSFTVCMNYYSNLHDKFKRGEFTYEEDARLLDLVYQYRMGTYIPWFKIVQHFKDRTRSQLHYRYTYYLSQNHKKKGKFTEAEDVLLMILVDKFGKNFKKCCEYLPSRSMVQCKSRYNSNLQGSIKKGSFTLEDDQIIMKFVEEYGTKSWTNLTQKLKRSRGQIRQRYHTIRQFLDANPQMKLDAVPRRKHNLKAEEDSFYFLRIVADQYKDSPSIPSLEEILKVLKSNKKDRGVVDTDSEEESNDSEEVLDTVQQKISTPLVTMSIDDMLTDFFCNSFKINSQRSISSLNLTRAAKDVDTVLSTLKVDLEIPDNFDVDKRLDNLDVAILNRLLEENSERSETGIIKYKTAKGDIKNLVPPNLCNVVGLRSLLIKFSQYKSEENKEMLKFIQGNKKQHFISGIRADIVNNLLHTSPNEKKQIEHERKLFYKRFYALFKWPAIMTLEGPSLELQSSTRSTNMETPIQVKRTYSRADRNNSSNPESNSDNPKRLKLPPLPPGRKPSQAVPLKLTPVTNKSVIEDLLRNKNKKLFCFDSIQCDGVTKTIIREIPLPKANTSTEDTSSATTEKCTEVNAMDSPAASSKQTKCEASSSQESFDFNLDQGECMITDVDDGESISSYGGSESVVDDEEDLKKLNMFIKEELHSEENDDLKDLEKLNMFLKTERDSGDSSDESSLFG